MKSPRHTGLYAARVSRIVQRMADEPDPPRRHYQLKPKEFELLNDPPAAFSPQAHKQDPNKEKNQSVCFKETS